MGDRHNSLQDAMTILFNDDVEEVIAPAGDVDWYSFETLQAGQWVLLETISESADLDTVVTLYASNGIEHAHMDNFDLYRITRADSSLVAWLPTAGTWYVAVEDVGTYYELEELNGGASYTYTLQLSTYEATTREGDPEPVVEIDLPNGETLFREGVLIDEDGDTDLLEVTMPAGGGVLQITGGNYIDGSQAVPAITVEDADGNTVLQQDALGDGRYGILFGAEQGTYTVHARDGLGNGGNDHWYVLYFRTYEEGATTTFFGATEYDVELEPNDTPEEAWFPEVNPGSNNQDLEFLGSYMEGQIEAPGDDDWYAFSVFGTDMITVRCYADRFGSLADLAFELYNPAAELVETVTEYDGLTSPQLYNWEAPETGEYRIRVYDELGEGGPGHNYRCQVVQTDWEVAE